MADKNQEQDKVLPEPNPNTLPDWYLQTLVKVINNNDAELPITLFIGGLVVSGFIVSGQKYFEGVGTQLMQAFEEPDDTSKEFVKALTLPGDSYKKIKEDPEAPLPVYVHLREARIFTSGQEPMPQEGAWWRGRLISVDGFHFGLLGVRKP